MARRKRKGREVRRLIKGSLVRLTSRRAPARSEPNGPGLTNGAPSDRLPIDFQDPENEGGSWLRLGSIMSAILVTGLVWIAMVCWFISKMPEK